MQKRLRASLWLPSDSSQRERRQLLALAWPIAATQLLQLSLVIVDTLFIGHLGSQALAAQSLAAAWGNLGYIAGFGFPLAVGTLVAGEFGRDRIDEAARVLRQGLWLALVFSLVLVAGFVRSDRVFAWLGEEPTAVAGAVVFLRALAWGIPANLAYQYLRQFSEGTSRPRPPLVIAAGAVVANVVLDYGLIYGHLGLPALGIRGAGLATAIVQWAMAFTLWGTLRASALLRLGAGPSTNGTARFGSIFRLGLPASGALIAEVGFYSAMTLLMGRFGGRDLAAHGIAMNALSLAFMVPLGLASAVAIRLAQSRGREDAKGAWRAASAGAELLQAVQLVTGIAFFGFPTAWVRPYTGDPALVAAAGPYLRMAGILFFFDGTQVLLMQALRGLRDTRVPFLITTAAYWGLGVPAGYQMAFAWSWGAKGLWYGMILALAAVTPLLFCRLRRNLSG